MFNLNSNGENKTIRKNPQTFYYIWHYLEWGGAQILFFGLMKQAQKIGKVKAIMPAGSNRQLLNFLERLNVECEFFDARPDNQPAVSFKRKIQRHLTKIKTELALINYSKTLDLKNAVVHTELTPWQSLLTLLWLCRKTQVFVTMHNAIVFPTKWRFYLARLKFAIIARAKNFHLFTANENTKKSLRAFVGDKFLEKVKVIYANVNLEEINAALAFDLNRADFLEKYQLPRKDFLVFCVGQFIDRKGRWIFLEAARELLKSNADLGFVWISNSRPSAEDLQRAKEFGLGENFVLLTSEQIGGERVDLFKVLRLADVFALPSYVEGLPISIIEAMALGIPTVSTDINAIPEAIKDAETGLLIEPGSSAALQRAIQKLRDDASLRSHLSKNGREYAIAKFDEKTVAKIAVEAYLEAFQKN